MRQWGNCLQSATQAPGRRLGRDGLLERFTRWRLWTRWRRFALRRAVIKADAQFLARDHDRFQVVEDFRRHAFRQVQHAVIVKDIDTADMLGFQVRFVGDGAHDVAWRHRVLTAHFDAVGRHARAWTLLLRRARRRCCLARVRWRILERWRGLGGERLARRGWRRQVRRVAVTADAQLLTRNPNGLQLIQQFFRHGIWQVQHAVIVIDFNAADVFRIDARFVGDGAHDIAWFHAMLMTDFNTESLHAGVGRTGDAFLFREGRAFATLAALRTVVAFEAVLAHRTVVLPGGLLARLVLVQQQRHIATRHLRQGGGDFDGGNILLAFEIFDQRLELFQFAQGQGFADLFLELGDTHIVDGLDGWQFEHADRLAGRAFDGFEQVLFTRGDEQDRFAAAAGAARAADAVGIAFWIVRHVVVDDVADALDIQAAGGHVGSNEDVDLAVFQLLDRALALRLLDVAIDGGSREAACLQFAGQLFRTQLGAGKDDHAVKHFRFQDAGQSVELVHARHQPVTLADVVGRARLGGNRHFGWIDQVSGGDALDDGRHGGREQRRLMAFRCFFQDAFDVVDKAHAQHFIGFIEYQRFQLGQVERTLVQVIDDATRRTDDDMHAAAQGRQLRAIALTAVDRQHVEAGNVSGVHLERFGDLDGQFARRCQDQGLG